MAEEEQQRRLERLRAVRGANRGVSTKLCREIDAVLAEESFNTDLSKLAHLNVIREQLDGKLKQLIKLDDVIVSLCSVGEIEGEVKDSEDITAKIIEAKRKIQVALRGPPLRLMYDHHQLTQLRALPADHDYRSLLYIGLEER